MSGKELVSETASKVDATTYAVLGAVLLVAATAMCLVGVRPVQALPSYARQTGQQCTACHNGFPELTPYGRQFKLNGYTWIGGTSDSIVRRDSSHPGGYRRSASLITCCV